MNDRMTAADFHKWKGVTFTPVQSATTLYSGTGRIAGEREYTSDVGDGSYSSLIEACVSWIANAVTQALPVVVTYKGPERFGVYDRQHAAARLIRRPTYDPRLGRSYYSWIPLIQATVLSLVVDGNAYWLKRRSAINRVVQLWYVPHWMIEPYRVQGAAEYLSYYRYRFGAQSFEVPPADIVHFRDGLDPDNTLRGLSKTKMLLREIYTDEAAAQFTASLLRRHAVPGIVVAPKMPLENPADADEVQRRLDSDFTGENRGRSMALKGPADVYPYGFSPEQMKLGDIRDIPEERVSVSTGVQAAVVGFGAGLQSTKVGATMAELVDLSWQNGALPRTRLIAAEATEQLLPDFGENSEDTQIEFDTTHVPIMADYHFKVAQKHELLVKGGIETRSQAKQAMGMKTVPDDDVYVLQAGVTMVNPDGTPVYEPPKSEPAPAAVPAPAAALALPSGDTTPAKGLTAREHEVAELVVKAMTNRQISEQLVISERTVDRHLENIMSKLDLTSRTQLAEWAQNAKVEDLGELKGEVKRLADEVMHRPEPAPQPAPIVNITVPPTPRRQVTKEVVRDVDGRITQVIETEEDLRGA